MYYLDFHKLYKQTSKLNRIIVRSKLDRDFIMTKRLKEQHNCCYYCNEPITLKDHLDHKIPIYYGGTNKLRNLVAACKNCNLIKGTQQIEITNPYTIESYLDLIRAKQKWDDKVKLKPWLKKYIPKKVQLHKVYRADLFKNN